MEKVCESSSLGDTTAPCGGREGRGGEGSDRECVKMYHF